MSNDIEKLGYDWITADSENADVVGDYYCQTRDVFEARLEKMKTALSENIKLSENRFLLSAIAGRVNTD